MMLIIELISLLGGSVVLVGAAGWLITKLVESRLNREIESYKTKLSVESDAAIENLKSRLQIAAKEREIAVNWLHQKRATAIETLYSSLVDLQRAIRIVLDIFAPRSGPDIRKFSAEAVAKVHQTYDAYLKAKIFLSPVTCEKIEKVLQGFENPVITYDLYVGNYSDDELHTLSDVKEGAWKDIQAIVPTALSELESDFRLVLGVDNHF